MTESKPISLPTLAEESDALTALIRKGAPDLLAQAIEAELAEMLAALRSEKTRGASSRCPQWLPARAGNPNGRWAGIG